MYKDYRGIYAGQNEFYRWGGKAQDLLKSYTEPNDKGFISVPADGGKYWTFGTSNSQYGEFAKYEDTCFSVNSAGYIWAKVGTPKAEKLIKMINDLVDAMVKKCRGE